VNQVVEEKKKRRWVQDSDRRRIQITKDNFVAVPLGRSRKEIATQWFQDLASSKPLSVLSRKVRLVAQEDVLRVSGWAPSPYLCSLINTEIVLALIVLALIMSALIVLVPIMLP